MSGIHFSAHRPHRGAWPTVETPMVVPPLLYERLKTDTDPSTEVFRQWQADGRLVALKVIE